MKNKVKIHESVFTGLDQRYIDYGNIVLNPQTARRRVIPPDSNAFKTPYGTQSLFSFVDHCHELRPWQQDIVNKLTHTNNDFYIIAQAGGGKTAPIICYWINEILGLNTSPSLRNKPSDTTIQRNINKLIQILANPETLDQIIWLAPIQSLNMNIELEFTERFIGGIIIQFLNRFVEVSINNDIILHSFPSEDTTIINAIRAMGVNSNETQLAENLINMIRPPDRNAPNLINSLTGQPILDERGLPLQNLTREHQYVPNSYTEIFRQQLGNLISKYTHNCLVGIKQEHTDTHLIINSQHPKPFVGCIYESAGPIIKNPNYNKLRLIICDEAQRLQGSPDPDDVRRARQIANSLHNLLKDRNTKAAKMIMLTATVRPESAQNMMHFLNATYNRRFKPGSLVVAPDRNPSDISVLPLTRFSSEDDQKRIIKQILNRGEKKVVFIIFGKEKINRLVDSLAPTESGYFPTNQPFSSSGTTSLYGKHNIQDIINIGQSINNLSDERLRRAVSHGIGFIYRQKGEMDVAHQRDSIIVQKLFMADKIRVLLCTDAIREGLNISINTMFIPTIKKPSGRGSYEPMELGGLTQLLNRVGRREGKLATIYCSPEDVSLIKTALSGNFENYDIQSYESPDKNKFSNIIDYWIGIMRGKG